MKFTLTLAAALLATGVAFAQNPPATQTAPSGATLGTPDGRSAADGQSTYGTTSGRPSDGTGTPSMAPSSGNSPSGEPDPGMGRGNK